jgi:membrane fusion protein (multidrug efflux system)
VTIRASKILMMLVVFTAAGGQWDCGKSPQDAVENPVARLSTELVVKAVAVSKREWTVTVPITGNLHTLSTVEIKPEVGGRLVAVYFVEGDLVRRNQLLAEIDTVNYRLAYDQAEAALKVAQAGLERAQVSADHAKTEKERADNLLRSGGITQKDHQAALTGIKDAESQVHLAEAQCGQARAVLAIADKALKDCKIYSQTEGHVQNRYFDRGSLLTPGVALYTIVDNSQLELECVIPSHQLARLRIGQHATFQTPTYGERRFEGVVSAINPEVESDNRSVRLKLKISNPRGELRSGMYARGEIVTDKESEALIIPRDSLIPVQEGSEAAGVYVVKEGKAHRRDIEIGDSQLDLVWVRRGLQEGELVIAEIGPSLKEGTPVRVYR